MTDKSNVTSDVGSKYNVEKEVARLLEAVFAITCSQIV